MECGPERPIRVPGEVRRVPQEPAWVRGNRRDRARKNPNRSRLGFCYWWRRRESNPRPQVLYGQRYMLSPLFDLTRCTPTGRLAAGDPLSVSNRSPRRGTALAHENDAATGYGSDRDPKASIPSKRACARFPVRPMSQPVQRLAGVRRRERNARRWRLLHSSGFTRELVLGMHCTASRPTSKPGRPLESCEVIDCGIRGQVPRLPAHSITRRARPVRGARGARR